MTIQRASRFCLFVPTFNVRDRVTGVLDRIPTHVLERFERIFVIDNGSRDGTRAQLMSWCEERKDPRFRLLFNEENYSLGGSTIIALRESIRVGSDFLVCMHGDGQADPAALTEFVDRARPDVDFILGSRFAERSRSPEYSALRWWGNRFFEHLQNFVVGQKLGDIGAYVAFNLKTVERLPFASLPHDMSYQPLLILTAAMQRKIRIESFPISWGKADRSNVNPFAYGLSHLARLARIALRATPGTGLRPEDFRTRDVTLGASN